jgi:hypothetical protein
MHSAIPPPYRGLISFFYNCDKSFPALSLMFQQKIRPQTHPQFHSGQRNPHPPDIQVLFLFYL